MLPGTYTVSLARRVDGVTTAVGQPQRIEVYMLDGDTPPRLKLDLGPQGALVAIDVQSRDIVALVGSYEGVPGNLDRARQARRQPGSSFKPILYAYALRAREVTPASVLDLKEKGHGVEDEPPYRMSVRRALAVSNNEAAEQLLLIDGPENVVAQAGTVFHLSLETIRRCITDAGYIPRQRNVFYEYLDSASGGRQSPDAPDNRV